MEIEAKFRIPDKRTFERLLEAAALAHFDLGQVSVADLHDWYLDTVDATIQASGLACRLRRTGDGYLATLKGLGGTDGAIHRRTEHQVALDAPLSPVDWPPGAARDLALRLCGNQPLLVLFEIRQVRHDRVVYRGDLAVVQLSLDRVRFVSQGLVAAACLELEAELLEKGREEDLEQLVHEFQTTWGLTPEARSKFERGLALWQQGMTAGEGVESSMQQQLTSQERIIVQRLALQPEVLARRARLLLAWDDGLSRAEIIERSRLSPSRVRYWLRSFAVQRLGIFPDRALKAAARGLSVDGVLPPRAEVIPAREPSPASAQVELLAKPGIEPDDPMSEAGRKTLRFHYRRMVYHEPGTRAGEDAEALHDMRVATRRMRAAFRVFGDYYDPGFVAPFLKGLKRTGRMLGAVRDLDVFDKKIRAHMRTLPEEQGGSLDDFLVVIQDQREKARQQMIAFLDSKKYRRFVQEFGEFVETEGLGSLPMQWDGDEPRPYRVCHVAPMAVYERLAAVRAYDEWVTVPHPPLTRLHALRIASKRLRYTLEFFGEVLGPDTDALVKEVVAIQDHLGDLQDAVVASAILRDFLVWGTWGHDARDRVSSQLDAPVVAPGVAAYLAAKQSELQHLLSTFPEAWQRITGASFRRMVAEAVVVL